MSSSSVTTSEYQSFIQEFSRIQQDSGIAYMLDNIVDGISEKYIILDLLMNNSINHAGQNMLEWEIETDFQRGEAYYGNAKLERHEPQPRVPMAEPRGYWHFGLRFLRTDITQNTGKDARVNYVKRTIKLSTKNMARDFSLILHGDGTNDANGDALRGVGQKIQGLQHYFTTTPTAGTVGGQNRSSHEVLQHAYLNITALGNLDIEDIRKLTAQTSHGDNEDTVNVVITSFEGINQLHKVIDRSTIITRKGSEKLTYNIETKWPGSFSYNGVDFIMDRGMTSKTYGGILDSSIKRMYFLNTKNSTKLMYDPRDDFKFEPLLKEIDYAAVVQDAFWNGQLANLAPWLGGFIGWS